jgi:hypothetical protein
MHTVIATFTTAVAKLFLVLRISTIGKLQILQIENRKQERVTMKENVVQTITITQVYIYLN